MTEDDRKFLEEAFIKTFDYEPDEDEVDKRYDDDFNNWCDNFSSKKQKNNK